MIHAGLSRQPVGSSACRGSPRLPQQVASRLAQRHRRIPSRFPRVPVIGFRVPRSPAILHRVVALRRGPCARPPRIRRPGRDLRGAVSVPRGGAAFGPRNSATRRSPHEVRYLWCRRTHRRRSCHRAMQEDCSVLSDRPQPSSSSLSLSRLVAMLSMSMSLSSSAARQSSSASYRRPTGRSLMGPRGPRSESLR